MLQVTFRLAYLHLTLAHSKVQSHMHIFTADISQTVTDKTNGASIANIYEVAYGLSIGIFAFDLEPFERSRLK